MKDYAVLTNDGKYTIFEFNNQRIRFITSDKLERYTKIVEWDNGYLVVMAKYKEMPEVEEYIDLIPILDMLYYDTETVLKPIKEVRIDAAYMSGCNGMLPTMFDVQPVARKSKIHQSELPVELCEKILEYVTYEGEIILDSFAGSGAVGVAALNKNRSCILIEILRENIEKIKERFNSILYQTVLE